MLSMVYVKRKPFFEIETQTLIIGSHFYDMRLEMMESATMDKKGKITIPSKIRKENALKEGIKFGFLKTEEGLLLIPLLTAKELNAQEQLIPAKKFQTLLKKTHQEELELENR
jgi:AbrB family looped-hinge helix DNA binding protein